MAQDDGTKAVQKQDAALLYGYELANGRDWFSLAFPQETQFDIATASLCMSGYLRPKTVDGRDTPYQMGNSWRRDYQITSLGFGRIDELTHNINWAERGKVAWQAYSETMVNEQPINPNPNVKGYKAVEWEHLPLIQQHAFINAARAIADSFNMRWTDSDIPVTSEKTAG